ncbi:MAG TPA: MarR family transcriptional regulator [Cyclobacteriaceae bacterium]|jgi:DNA-binding MarR family transcriptional regulator|nr:MarR family transcriptional regulator [Cyclobacteriaceae bacterium]
MKIEDEIQTTRFRSPFHKAAVNLIFTAGWVEDNNREYFKSFGITPQQFNILRILRGQHPGKISVTEIKARMLDKNSDVSRLLSRLISKGFIGKSPCPNDKRAADILITEQGLSVLKKIDQGVDQTDLGLFNLTSTEADQLNFLLDKCRG